MESYEVLGETIKERGAKSIAHDIGLSASLIYKWCESKDGGGSDNPLDRIRQICELTGSVRPVEWLCEQTGGFRIDNPQAVRNNAVKVLQSTQKILKEFTDLLEAVSVSYNNDSSIDQQEAGNIRREWEELKVAAESFVVSCEKGMHK